MNTKLILTASAILLAALGISFTFLPEEIAAALSIGSPKALLLLLQLLGALYVGFAMLNWMAKGSLIGGIYNRPLVVANFTHFLVGGLALGKGVADVPNVPAAAWALAGLYVLFAVLFGVLLFRHPIRE